RGVYDVRRLRRVVVRVDRDKHSPGALQAQVRDDPVERARGVQTDALSRLDTELGEPARDALSIRAQLVSREAAGARAQHDLAAGFQQLGGKRARAEPPPERLDISRGRALFRHG